MQILYSPLSPFVRKCLVTAIELGLGDRIERVPVTVTPITRVQEVVSRNPVGKIPALITDDGQTLYDSAVICEYLDSLGGGRLIPASGNARWQRLTEQALADGLMDAAVLLRYETALRPESCRWPEWVGGQTAKIVGSLDAMEAAAAAYGERIDIGTISAGCALGYLDLRFPVLGWREARPVLAKWFDGFVQRDSMQATRAEV
ncbi:MAG: glutathione S-transferase [Burkholderiaceae bacterium]